MIRERLQAMRRRRRERRLAANRILDAFATAFPRAFFIEIGASDGVDHAILRPYIETQAWRGILVEPVPHLFERLRRNYEHRADALVFENAAVAEHDGTASFYQLAWEEAGRTRVLDVFGSLSAEAVERSGSIFVPDEHRRVIRSEVPCTTFASLCRRHGVESIDLLMVDTEGHDLAVLEQVDFERYRPALVAYEHLFLSPAERERCRARLEKLGYVTLAEQRDTWCLDPGADAALTRRWRRLRPAMGEETIAR